MTVMRPERGDTIERGNRPVLYTVINYSMCIKLRIHVMNNVISILVIPDCVQSKNGSESYERGTLHVELLGDLCSPKTHP